MTLIILIFLHESTNVINGILSVNVKVLLVSHFIRLALPLEFATLFVLARYGSFNTYNDATQLHTCKISFPAAYFCYLFDLNIEKAAQMSLFWFRLELENRKQLLRFNV